MFRTDHKNSRVDYSAIFKPPKGYEVDSVIGTTYSLDFKALTAVIISLGLGEDVDINLACDPASVIVAYQKMTEKMVVFCESGQIKGIKSPTTLDVMLEKIIVPVALDKKGYNNGYPSFHPKVWIIKYKNDNNRYIFRFAVLSRNLTFDRSWDVSLCIESADDVYQHEKTKPIIHFLEFLNSQIKNTYPDSERKKRIIQSMAECLMDVSFSVSDLIFDDFEIMPIGIGAQKYDIKKKDKLLCGEHGLFKELVVVSPFLSPSVVYTWNMRAHEKKGARVTLITRKNALDGIAGSKTDLVDIYTLKDELLVNDELPEEDNEWKNQDIHAKMYLFGDTYRTDFYLGSMNSTVSGINDNVEMLICIRCSRKKYSASDFLADLFCGEADNNSNPFEKIDIEGELDRNKDDDDEGVLENVLKTICRLNLSARVDKNESDDRKHDIYVTAYGYKPVEGIKVTISPLFCKSVDLADRMVFYNVDKTKVTEFYNIRIKGSAGSVIDRIIMIPTENIPEGRDDAIIRDKIDDNNLLACIRMFLGTGSSMARIEARESRCVGNGRKSLIRTYGIYEDMLKAVSEDAECLRDIERFLMPIKDKEMASDLVLLCECFKKALEEKNKGGLND